MVLEGWDKDQEERLVIGSGVTVIGFYTMVYGLVAGGRSD